MMGRLVTILCALLLGLVGLFMSLCGGSFTVMSIFSDGNFALLLIAVPSAAAGVFLLVVTYRIFRGLRS
jgi:hypothetical protein